MTGVHLIGAEAFMKALKFNTVGTVEVTNEPEPEPLLGDVLIDVAYAGICGSDLHGIRSGGYRNPPLIMGHEVSGVTPDGRRVAVHATFGCGRCEACLTDREQLCADRTIMGITRSGGFAERMAVPERALIDLPDDVSLEVGALIEPLAVGLRAWNRSAAARGERVGIIGAGNVGLMILTVGLTSGAHITITDLVAVRREAAARLGADEVSDGLDGSYDVLFDAVGTAETHTLSLAHLKPGGRAVWVGTRSPEPAFDALDLVRSEKSVIASFAYNRDEFVEAIQLARERSFEWIDVVDIDDSADVFMALARGEAAIVKALVKP